MKAKESCITKINGYKESFTESEKKIANYILENFKEVVYLPINELATKCGTSEPTIVRFCRRLGYKGFQEFKLLLSRDIIEPSQYIHGKIKKDDDQKTIINKIASSNIDAIKETANMVDIEQLKKAITALKEAKEINIIGYGGSGALAIDAYNKFLQLGLPCRYQNDYIFQNVITKLLSQKSVIFGISSSGRTKEVIKCFKEAKKVGVTTIIVTSSFDSPIIKYSDICLFAAINNHFHSKMLETRIGVSFILDILYISMAFDQFDKTIHHLHKATLGYEATKV